MVNSDSIAYGRIVSYSYYVLRVWRERTLGPHTSLQNFGWLSSQSLSLHVVALAKVQQPCPEASDSPSRPRGHGRPGEASAEAEPPPLATGAPHSRGAPTRHLALRSRHGASSLAPVAKIWQPPPPVPIRFPPTARQTRSLSAVAACSSAGGLRAGQQEVTRTTLQGCTRRRAGALRTRRMRLRAHPAPQAPVTWRGGGGAKACGGRVGGGSAR